MKAKGYLLCLLAVIFTVASVDAFGQVNWTRYSGNPVLGGGAYGSWYRQVLMPSVLYNADSARFEMWFAGSAYPYTPQLWMNGFGFAVSNDGVSWTMHPTRVLTAGETDWESGNIDIPCVIRENGQYKMWYSGGQTYRKTGYATSPDGINWTKYSGNPVFEPKPNSWDAGLVHCGFVMPAPGDTGGYRMYYSGGSVYIYAKEEIGVAYSRDGIVWVRDTVRNPILPAGPNGTWDDTWIFAPRILHKDSLYYMWYGGTGEYWGIYWLGLATSPDGISWHRYAGNPVLTPSPGGWDAYKILSGCVLSVGDSLYMWYDAVNTSGSGQLWKIGLAKSLFIPVSVGQETIRPSEFALQQNYPNPFNPSTSIRYSLPHTSFVTLRVHNILGQQVAQLVNEQQQAGYHDVVFRGDRLASGVYFYRIQTGDFVASRKLLLLK